MGFLEVLDFLNRERVHRSIVRTRTTRRTRVCSPETSQGIGLATRKENENKRKNKVESGSDLQGDEFIQTPLCTTS